LGVVPSRARRCAPRNHPSIPSFEKEGRLLLVLLLFLLLLVPRSGDLIADAIVELVAGLHLPRIHHVLRAVLEHPADHRIGARTVRALVDRPLHRAILKPHPPPLERLVPRPPEILRPGPVAQLVERLEALADLGRRLRDDPARGEMVDEGALHIRRDRIAARLLVAIGQEVEQRVVLGKELLPKRRPRCRLPRDLALVDEQRLRGGVGGGRALASHGAKGDCTDFPSRKIGSEIETVYECLRPPNGNLNADHDVPYDRPRTG